jgi:glycosyltransferase involved in cell wall biosynthesis
VDLLLDALEQLEPADWEKIEIFRIHGGGPLAKDVRRRAAGLVNAGRPVSVGGYLDKAGAEDLIAESDWLVIPSRVESIPLIYSDALKLRCAVLATPVGDLPELIVRHRSGELAEVVSAAALCRLFSDVLERRRPVDYCGGLGRAAAEFSLTSVARHLDPHVGTTDTAV